MKNEKKILNSFCNMNLVELVSVITLVIFLIFAGCSGSDSDSEYVDNDGDGYSEEQGDYNDNDADINPESEEISGDVTDQDCDGSDCTNFFDDGDQKKVVLSVPFEPNHADSKGCGTCCSSSFTMILKYLEPSVNFEDVFSIFGCPPFNNEYQKFMDWVNTTYTHLNAWGVCEATIEDVIEIIDSGYPVVVHQVFSLSEATGHNRVVIGYDLEQDSFILNDPSDLGANYRMDFDTFEKLWFDISTLEPVQPYCMWVIDRR